MNRGMSGGLGHFLWLHTSRRVELAWAGSALLLWRLLSMVVPELRASSAKLVVGGPGLADGEGACGVGFAMLVEVPQLLANSVQDTASIFGHRNNPL